MNKTRGVMVAAAAHETNQHIGHTLPEDWGELPISCTGIQRVWLWAKKTFLLTQGLLAGDSVETDTVGGCMVMGRAIEIATNDGRSAIDLSRTDIEQAKRELTGETE